jgi:hypothetical protein
MRGAEPAPKATVVELAKRPLRRLRADYRLLTSPLRGLPTSLVIGAQRGGTTSLFNYLAQHPDVLPPLGKEIHYFDYFYHRGIRYYRGRFPYLRQLQGGRQTLDATPYYMMHPLAPERAARLLPQVKLIAMLRDPVARALSHYQHEVRGGRESLSFAEAIEQEAGRLTGEEERLRREPQYYSWNHHRYGYTRRGLYLEQLRRWLAHFPRSQLLVLQSEALFRDPAGIMARVHGFLGLRDHRLDRYEDTYQQGKYQRAMPDELKAKLSAYFAPYNRELFQFLGEEFDWS